MAEQDRTDAITRFQEHEAEARGRVAKRERQRKHDVATWSSAVLPTISLSIHRVSEDFAAHGSAFQFSSIPVQTEGSAMFRIKTSEGFHLLSKLQFDLVDGRVTATSTVGGTDLPLSVELNALTHEWVELVAEGVLIAALNAA
jgi:hypothetical protein